MRKLLTILIVLFFAVVAHAQSNKRIRIYQHNGAVDTLLMQNGSSIAHSRLDLQGQEHDDIVSIIISNVNTVPVNVNVSVEPRQYLIADIDSIVTPNGKRVVFRAVSEVPVPVNVPVNSTVPVRRTSFSGTFPGTAASGNVIFYWTENDHIRLDVGDESRAETLTGDKRGADFIFDDLDDSVGSYVVYYPDKTVTIPTVQTQSGADNTDHIGRSGDCGTATATRQQDGTYSFTLDHKAAYLCFLPHINHLPSVKIKKIEVSCSGNIAGTFSLSKSGLYNGKNTSNKIVLNLNTKKDKDFFLGHDYHSEQDSCAAYMVIAPCGSQTFVASYYVTDTLSRMDKVLRQTFTLNPQPNTVYPVEFNIRDLEFRAVDMGLSVNWSNVNVNAPVPTSHGTYYDNDADANAALLSQTTVTEWLMPDADQREELLEKCQWEWVSYDGVNGYLVTAPSAARDDGNVHRLFIPSKSNTQVTPEAALSAVCRPVEALMIDLGLPSNVKWASRNVGANSVEDYGNYYAWGETETKDSYSSSVNNYPSQNSNLGNALDIAGTLNDAAFVNMGGAWHMPRKKDLEELKDLCQWSWQQINGVNGYIITGLNGNRIFLPAAGTRTGTGTWQVGSGASYASSNQVGENSWYAWCLIYKSTSRNMANANYNELYGYNDNQAARYIGRPVRAVVSNISSDPDDLGLTILTDSSTWKLGDTQTTLYGTLTSMKPIKGSVTVGFVIGDSMNIVRGKARDEYTEERVAAGRFSTTLDVFDNIGYYYRAFVQTNDTIIYGEARQYGYVMVDLGLPSGTLWANMNLGASKPEDYGYYYSWAETYTKQSYTSDNYPLGSTNVGYGVNRDIAGSELDAAHVNMGNAWKMPTKPQMQELFDDCDWVHTTYNNVNGFVITGPNGQSIFLPDAGVRTGTSLNVSTYGASYPTSWQGGDLSSYAWTVVWNRGSRSMCNGEWSQPFSYNAINSARYCGRPVRAVFSPGIVTPDGMSLTILTDSAVWRLGDTSATVYGTMSTTTPINGTVKVGFIFGDSANIVRSNSRTDLEYTREVTRGSVFSHTINVFENFGYWYRAYVETNDTIIYGEAKHYGYEVVDLGLPSGTKWCNMNIGANRPEEYGDYFAWGEITPKESYTLNNYVYYDNGYQNLHDDYNIAGSRYDAAKANMGDFWRMPTQTQLEELLSDNNCEWIHTVENNINGFKVVSKRNGRYIFLPASGLMNGSNHRGLTSEGFYWGSTQGGKFSEYGSTLMWSSSWNRSVGNANWTQSFSYNDMACDRWYGRSVRAVYAPNANASDGKMMSIVTDSAQWTVNSATATVYATMMSTTPIDGEVTVGFVFGETADVDINSAAIEYHKTVSEKCSYSTSVSVSDNIGYWYRAYLRYGNEVFYGEAKHFGWEMVDLGLPSGTLWCNVNVGAEWPEQYGNYYAWGETEPKDSYTRENYLYNATTYDNLGDITSTQYDAAYTNMDNSWCMPNSSQLEELRNQCNWNMVVVNGINGYRVSSKTNNNYIFLPSAGMVNGSSRENVTSEGSFFGSTQGAQNSMYAWVMGWNTSGSHGVGNAHWTELNSYNDRAANRYYGRSIRPVAVMKAQH